MFIHKCKVPWFQNKKAVAARHGEILSQADIQKEIEKLPGVKFETIDGKWVVTGLSKLTAADIPADVHPLIRNYLLRNRHFTMKERKP